MNKSDEIIKIAIKLFSEKGYHATSMRMIANKANIVQSSIYNHYKNKESILIAIAKLMKKEIENTFNFEAGISRVRKIQQYKANIIESLRTKSEFWKLIHSMRMNSEITEIIKQESEEMQSMITHNLSYFFSKKRQNNNQAEILLFWAAIDGIVAAYLLMDQYPLENVLTELLNKYMKGD